MAYPDSKFHGANMGSTWVLSAPDGTHVGPMNLAIRVVIYEAVEKCCMALGEWIFSNSFQFIFNISATSKVLMEYVVCMN